MATALPSVEDALAALDRLPADWVRPAGLNAGQTFVTWQHLAFALFPKGSPLWQRPVGKPYGQDESPASAFMNRLQFDDRFATVTIKGRTLYGRR